MIRKTWNTDKWLLTSQAEHARIAALMAASWNCDGEKPPDEVTKAILTHDDGWKESDAAPPVKPDGDPQNFNEMRLADVIPIFSRSIELRIEAGHQYGASLVTGHFMHLVQTADLSRASTGDAKAAGQFLGKQGIALRASKAALEQDELGASLLANYDTHLRFLQVCDLLSLLLCTDFSGEQIIEDVPYLRKGNTLQVRRSGKGLALSLDPLPFKKNLRDHLMSWAIPYMPYDCTEELQMAMEEMKTISNEVHLGSHNG